MNLIQEYIKNENRNAIISKFLDQGAWNWILYNIGLYNFNDDIANQIGKAYIRPNPYLCDDHEECKENCGYTWGLTNDKKYIRITYNTVKNQYLDINEDNEVVLTFDEFLKYV